MNEEEQLLLDFSPEELKQASKLLTDALANTLRQPSPELFVVTCVSGCQIVREDQITQVISLDIIASASAGVLDPLGQLRDWFISVFNSVSSWIVSGIQTFIQDIIVPAIKAVSDFLSGTVLPAIKGVVTSIGSAITDAIKSITSTISKFISDAVSTISKGITSVLSTLSNAITGAIKAITDALSSVGKSILDSISGIIKTVSDILSIIGKTITDFIAGSIKTLTDIIGTVAKKITDAISGIVSTLTNIISGAISTISNVISGILSAISTAISGAIATISNALTSVATSIMNAISGVISTISNAIAGFATTIMNTITNAISTLSNIFSGIASSIMNALTGMINTISATLSGIAKTIIDAFGAIGKTILDAISSFIKAVSDTLGTVAKTIMDGLAGIGKGITDLWNFLVGAFQDVAAKVGAGFQVIGNALMGFINGIIQAGQWIVNAIQNLGAVIWQALPDWLKGGLTAIGNFFSAIVDGVKALIADPVGWFSKNIVQPIMGGLNWLWNALQGVWNWITSAITKFGEWLWNGILALGQGLVSLLSASFKGLIDIGGKLIGGIRDILIAPILDLFKAVFTGLKDYVTGMVQRIAAGKSQGEMAEALGLFGVIVSTQFTFRMISQALFWIGEMTSDWKLLPNVAIKILGAGGETTVEIPLKFGNVIKHLASEFRQYPDELMRGFFYGIAIWITQPIVRCINSLFRNTMPIELPTVEVLVEATRRTLPHEKFKEMIGKARYFMSLYGYSDYVIDLYFKTAKEFNIKVTDRFGTERAIPLSLMYQLPSSSDVATMMVRDIFASIEDFQKLYLATGMEKDVGALYYFLRFRYPPPERLWQFTVRGISGLLWTTLSDAERADVEKEVKSIGALMPVAPINMNFQADKLLNAFKTYMKWHDYFRGCVPEGELILGDNKPIETYEVGDHTLLGGTVEATYRKYYRGKAVKIKAHDILELKVTPEHVIPVMRLARKWIIENGKDNFKLVPVKIVYKHADEIEPAPKTHPPHYHEGDYLLVPILRGDVYTRELDLAKYLKKYTDVRRLTLPLDEDVAWFMGFYVAEGHSQDKYISVSQSEENEEIINKVCAIINKLGYKSVVSRHRGIAEIYIKSPILARAFIDWFEKGARNKKIPDFILHHKDRNIVKAFIKGYIVGDGCISNNSNEAYLYTVSKTLALQLQLLLLRLGYIAGVSYREKANGYMIRYMVHDHRNKLVRRLSEFIDFSESNLPLKRVEDYLLVPVSEVEFEDYEGSVYDLQVENDHFLVSNVVVHNSWIKDFPSDNLIYIDTLAEVPTKIEQRWICKWGIYELLSAKQVTYQSTVKEFATKILENTPASEVKMDLTNFSRTILATGLHPDWVPITAVAEAMNALTEERTALRTGFMGLFKEGFYDIKALETMLAGFIKTSFQVAYFDIAQMKWTTGWVNIPVMYLPPERKLLELRALMDRSLDILREIQKDISTAYQEFIIWDYNEYKSKLTQVIESINDFYATDYEAITGVKLPDQLKLKFVEDYYKPYVEALKIWRDVFTIRRIRMWTQRWLGWVMYRVAYGVVEKDDISKLVTYVKEKGKLTDGEEEFIKQVMELMYGIARRSTVAEYLPTPSTLATLSEYMTLDTELVKQVLVERGLDEAWQKIWLTYIAVRPIKSDAKALLSTYVRGFRYGVVTKDKLENFIKTLPQYGFTEKEINFIIESINIEEQILEAKSTKAEYLPTPSTLATLSEYVAIPMELVKETLKERAVPAEWADLWMQYVAVKPIKADAKALLSTYVRAFRYGAITKETLDNYIKTLPQYGFTQREVEFIIQSVQLEEQILDFKASRQEYIPTPSMLATICEIIPEAREFFDDVVKARNIPTEWQKVWAKYIDLKPVIDEVKKYVSRAEQLYVRFMITEENFKKVLDEVRETLGYTQKEIEFMLQTTRLEKHRVAWTELIGDVDRMTMLAEYSPKAREFALGTMYKMIDALPIDQPTKEVLKEMWTQYIRIKPVKDEVGRYVTDLINAYVAGTIDATAYAKELDALREWGLDDYEIQFYKSIATLRRARKLKIALVYPE
jgi:phage-related protein/intein/homing endonuclease